MAEATTPSDGPTPRPWDTPESHVWIEDLMDCVWRCERDWRFNDRLDMATRSRRQERT